MGRETRDSLRGWLRARLGSDRGAAADVSQGSERAQQRAPGTSTCDICARAILAGEEISHFRRDDRLVAVCSLCEANILAQGFVRAA